MVPDEELTVQGHSEVATTVGYSVEAKLVGHVRHLVLSICLFGDDGHLSFGLVVFWKGIAGLSEISAQYLHEAVCISVVVNGASLSWRPNKYKLFRFLSIYRWLRVMHHPRVGLQDMTYQIALAISLVDKVTSVASTSIAECILGPLHVAAVICSHQLHQVANVDILGRQARRRTKAFLECQYELLEKIPLPLRYDVAYDTERVAA